MEHIHNATINIANYGDQIYTLKNKINDIERNMSSL